MQNQNTVNLSQKTNIMAGSPEFNLGTLYIQRMSVPGISFSHPELGGRTGTKFSLGADTASFNTLDFDVIVDENLLVYNELMQTILSQINYEDGTFSGKTFEFWISTTDSFGKENLKWDFHNCRIESIGDLDYDYSDESTEYLLNIALKYDYFTFKHLGSSSNVIPTLNGQQ